MNIKMNVNWKRILLVLAIVLLNASCDQLTKQLAREQLIGAGQLSYLGDFFRLSYVENKGAFLSLGAGLTNCGAWRYSYCRWPCLPAYYYIPYFLKALPAGRWWPSVSSSGAAQVICTTACCTGRS